MQLAATDHGVYRSADAGVTWAQTTLASGRVWAVGFDPRAPNPAFAGLDGAGIASSTTAGATWSTITAGLPSPTVRSLAFSLSGVIAGTTDGVAVSPDGTTWRSAGLAGYDVSSLAVLTNAPALTVAAGTDGAPPGSTSYLFTNAGLNAEWKPAELPGVDPTKHPVTVGSLAAGPIDAATQTRPLLASTNQGLFRTADNAVNWTQTYPPAGAEAVQAAMRLTTASFSPIDPKLVYAGSDAGGSAGGQMLRSTDGGLTWGAFDQGLPPTTRNVATLAVSPTNPPLVVVALDPPAAGGVLYAQTDATAPTPAPVGTPEAAVPLPSPTSLPPFSPPPEPVNVAPPPATGSTGLRRLLDWPLPLAAELLVLVGAVYVFLRWRQRRLDIEGPP